MTVAPTENIETGVADCMNVQVCSGEASADCRVSLQFENIDFSIDKSHNGICQYLSLITR